MMAVNASTNQLGSVVGSSTGSLLISAFSSYMPLGLAFGSFALISSGLIHLFVTESDSVETEKSSHE
jgi:predicted MFS family arabinose efflux permease